MTWVPKQFRHWAAEYGFRREARYSKEYFVNRRTKRRMRVLPSKLQLCDGDFDRWANSMGFETTIPRNQNEFRAFMKDCGL